MKTINLTKGYVALVDDDDYERLSMLKWSATVKKTNIYASVYVAGKNKRMHRIIMNAPPELQVDHIDGNGLNNQKSNLRLCTNSQNSMNKGKRNENTSSKYKGVYYVKAAKSYRAEIQKDGKKKVLYGFKTQEEAALAYNKAAIELHGEFARLNVIF